MRRRVHCPYNRRAWFSASLHSEAHPRFIEPMECKRVPKFPDGDAWVYEPKQDGYRVIAVIDGSASLLYSMSGLNYTAKYLHIAEALKWLKIKEAVFDGEVTGSRLGSGSRSESWRNNN